jgi:hypothetical protein
VKRAPTAIDAALKAIKTADGALGNRTPEVEKADDGKGHR